MPTNDFVPFCPTNTGTNLLSQAEYLASPYLPIGNQPGVASSKLTNKAMRQASYIVACVTQFLVNATGDDILDDENESNVLATMAKVWASPHIPTIQRFLTGSGTYTLPTSPRKPLFIKVRMAGGGGGAGGSGVSSTGGAGSAGGNTTFGAILTAPGGGASSAGNPGAGGIAPTVSSPAVTVVALAGAPGAAGQEVTGTSQVFPSGGVGGQNTFGGAGNSPIDTNGNDGLANTGAGGGGGGGTESGSSPNVAGGGGGAGAYIEAIIPGATAAATYAYAVGAGGGGGSAGTSGHSGGGGGSGVIIVEEFY